MNPISSSSSIPTLLKIVNVEAGLKDGGVVILNTRRVRQRFVSESGIKARLATVDASKIAMETMRVPITNTTMLGALVKATGLIEIGCLEGPIKHRFGPIAAKNLNACSRALKKRKMVEV